MATYYVTVDGGDPTHDGSTWANAFSASDFFTELDSSADPTDIYYVEAGTYTPGGAIDGSDRDGGVNAPITIIGVKDGTTAEPPTYADWPTVGSADRPTIAAAGNALTFGDYWKTYNVIFTSTAATAITLGISNIFYNNKIYGSRTSAQTGVSAGSNSVFISCEFTGDSNAHDYLTGLNFSSHGFVMFSHFHGILKGAGTGSSANVYLFNTFYDCVTYGIGYAGNAGIIILNNAFQSCATAVSGTTGQVVAINNAFASISADAFISTTQEDSSFFFKNMGYENAGDVVDMWHGVATSLPHGDPTWSTDNESPAFDGADNMSLQAGSPALNNALSPVLGT